MTSIRKLSTLAAAALAFTAAGAFAQAPQREFTLLNPAQPTEGGGKIEVLEFFWYGCGHCFKLDPFIEKWVAAAPKDVVFKRVPAIPNEAWGQTALIFFTLESMGLLDKYHGKVFEAIHLQNVNLNNEKKRDEWVTLQGIDLAKFKDVAKSFAVVSKMNRARQLTGSYKIDGVPMLVVNGKYVTSNTHANGDLGKVMVIVDRLVEMARREGKTASAPAPVPAAAAAPKKQLELVKK